MKENKLGRSPAFSAALVNNIGMAGKATLNEAASWRCALPALALAIACLMNTGCATTGYDKSAAASASMQQASAEVQAESRALDFTLSSLNDLVNKPGPDLRFQFQQFGNNLDQLIATDKRNEAAAMRVNQKIGTYFKNWDQELVGINYEAVRTRSEARKAEVAGRFESINGRYHETLAAIKPVIGHLIDIRKALQADLTLNGLEAMKGAVSNADADAAKVQMAFSKLAPDLAASGTQMSSVTVQAAQQ